ncbi:hypothetical protein MSPP1_000139 [Malassezia sp. CBS 17886]|nr:hypothetical protein MSPP1_000139 [Malassezia sp. CBS 17886]
MATGCAQAQMTAAPLAPGSDAPARAAAMARPALQCALMVTRQPVLQRAPTPLEREYYKFNRKLANTLQQPFPRDVYFKKGSAAESRFDEYYAQLQNTWDITTETKDPAATQADKGSADATESADTLYATMPRTTAADAKNDVRSLERALDRTLYLVVSHPEAATKGPTWGFPAKALPVPRTPGDSLHSTAADAVSELLGTHMDLWLVSKLPIAVILQDAAASKTYVLRSHVLAGHAAPEAAGVDYAWLTKEEVQQRLADDRFAGAAAYWETIEPLLDE